MKKTKKKAWITPNVKKVKIDKENYIYGQCEKSACGALCYS